MMLLDGYFIKKCECSQSKGWVTSGKERGKCTECKKWYKHEPIEKCTDPELLIIAAESELEAANYHSLSSLASDMFNAIKKLVEPEKHLELAKAIIDTIQL